MGGLIAGAIAAVVTAPIDLIKTRIQVVPLEGQRDSKRERETHIEREREAVVTAPINLIKTRNQVPSTLNPRIAKTTRDKTNLCIFCLSFGLRVEG